jgi:hypothetical protein
MHHPCNEARRSRRLRDAASMERPALGHIPTVANRSCRRRMRQDAGVMRVSVYTRRSAAIRACPACDESVDPQVIAWEAKRATPGDTVNDTIRSKRRNKKVKDRRQGHARRSCKLSSRRGLRNVTCRLQALARTQEPSRPQLQVGYPIACDRQRGPDGRHPACGRDGQHLRCRRGSSFIRALPKPVENARTCSTDVILPPIVGTGAASWGRPDCADRI